MHGKTAQWTAEEFDKFLTDKTFAFSNVEFDGQCKTTILFLALSINFGGLATNIVTFTYDKKKMPLK